MVEAIHQVFVSMENGSTMVASSGENENFIRLNVKNLVKDVEIVSRKGYLR